MVCRQRRRWIVTTSKNICWCWLSCELFFHYFSSKCPLRLAQSGADWCIYSSGNTDLSRRLEHKMYLLTLLFVGRNHPESLFFSQKLFTMAVKNMETFPSVLRVQNNFLHRHLGTVSLTDNMLWELKYKMFGFEILRGKIWKKSFLICITGRFPYVYWNAIFLFNPLSLILITGSFQTIQTGHFMSRFYHLLQQCAF